MSKLHILAAVFLSVFILALGLTLVGVPLVVQIPMLWASTLAATLIADRWL